MPDFTDAKKRLNWEKHGERISVLDTIPQRYHAGIYVRTNTTYLDGWINDAIQALHPDGDSLYFPRGSYKVGASIVPKAGVRLYGVGFSNSVKDVPRGIPDPQSLIWSDLAIPLIRQAAESLTITGITNAVGAVVTAPGCGAVLVVNEIVSFRDVAGMAQMNKHVVVSVSAVTANTFTIALDTSAYGTYAGGGKVIRALACISIEGLGFKGVVNASGSRGVWIENGYECQCKELFFANFGDQGLTYDGFEGGRMEQIFTQNCLTFRTGRTVPVGTIEIGSTDMNCLLVNGNASVDPATASLDGNIFGLLFRSPNCYAFQCTGQLSEQGIYVDPAGFNAHFTNCRADTNALSGWVVAAGGCKFVGNWSFRNSQKIGNYYGWYVTAGPNLFLGNQVSTLGYLGGDTNNMLFGFRDDTPSSSVGNTYSRNFGALLGGAAMYFFLPGGAIHDCDYAGIGELDDDPSLKLDTRTIRGNLRLKGDTGVTLHTPSSPPGWGAYRFAGHTDGPGLQGVVSVANGSTAVTWVSGDVFTTFPVIAPKNRININGHEGIVASVTDSHHLVLAAPYAGTTSGAANYIGAITYNSILLTSDPDSYNAVFSHPIMQGLRNLTTTPGSTLADVIAVNFPEGGLQSLGHNVVKESDTATAFTSDLTGTYPSSLIVSYLNGHPLNHSVSLVNGMVWTWDNATGYWVPKLGGSVLKGTGSPQGLVSGTEGTMYEQEDAANPDQVWWKKVVDSVAGDTTKNWFSTNTYNRIDPYPLAVGVPYVEIGNACAVGAATPPASGCLAVEQWVGIATSTQSSGAALDVAGHTYLTGALDVSGNVILAAILKMNALTASLPLKLDGLKQLTAALINLSTDITGLLNANKLADGSITNAQIESWESRIATIEGGSYVSSATYSAHKHDFSYLQGGGSFSGVDSHGDSFSGSVSSGSAAGITDVPL